MATFNSEDHVIITTHRSPDGDALGSSLALYHHLKDRVASVTVLVPDQFPSFLSWMPGAEDCRVADQMEDTQLKELFSNASVVACLDFNAISRCGVVGPYLRNADCRKLVYDHHQQPEGFHDGGVIKTEYASTCEIIFELIDTEGEITEASAQCLYTGILTDTGSFRFDSTTELTHQKVAKLLSKGVNPAYIYKKVHDNYSESRTRLIGYALNDNMRVVPELKTAIIALSADDLQRFNYVQGDTEGLVNMPLSIANVEVSILVSEKDGLTKMSFRSKTRFNVNEFARAHFKGGGHINAAGGISDLSASETSDKLVSILESYKDELQNLPADM